MNIKRKKDNGVEMIDIIKDAIVTYNDGDKKLFEAIHITDKKILTGYVLKMDNKELNRIVNFFGRAKNKILNSCCEQFIERGGIPGDSILSIKGGNDRAIYIRRA